MQGRIIKRFMSVVLSLCLLTVSLFTGITVTAEDTVAYEAKRITIHPGIDETHLNFSWHSDEKAETASVRIKVKDSEDEWTVFTGESAAVETSASGHQAGYHDTQVKNCGHTCSDTCGHPACSASECYHGIYASAWYNRVTVSGLEFGVDYTYQLGDGTNWTQNYTTSIADTDPEEGFQYLVFGDSQTADQYYGDYMKNALELALNDEKFQSVDFMMNLGDNIHENNDRNYNAYFTSQDILSQVPIAVVMGNHELNIGSLENHPALTFTNPPAADERQDYWFRYGDVLFITFNSGPQQTSMMTDLDQLIADAKAAHPDTRWTILQTHQGFYSNNGGGKVWRRDFVPIIDKYDIDMVFVGHHHLYTRTESMIYPDDAATCEHDKSTPDWSCEVCSGYIETLGENDVTVPEVFVATDGTETEYNKTTERTDPEGTTYMHLDSLTAEGHDQYYTGSSSLAPTSAFSINTVAGQGAITLVTVTKDSLKTETFWINNNGTPRISNSADLSLLDDDYIDDVPYDTYTIHKTSEVKEIEVTFDGGTDRGIFTRRINAGETVAIPDNPIVKGKSFKYWTLDGETEFDFATAINEDITLTAVYEDIPATKTAELFIEAIARADEEIELASDITLSNLGEIVIDSNTVIKSVEGQRYTLTLDGSSRLTVAKGKKVTLQGINITIAATADQITDAYNNGTYITVGSGGNKANLYIYDCTINSLLTDMGASGTGVIGSSKNASSFAQIENSTITSAVTNTSTGGSILGQYITVRAKDTSMTNAKSGAWFCTSSTTVILEGTSDYVGWKHSSAKLYDFRNVSVKAARNPDNLIELSKIGSGAAVTNDNYKIYYCVGTDGFSSSTAVEYTEAIDGVDFTTPIYVAIRYTGTSYYSVAVGKYCGEYIEGVAVSSEDELVSALENGEAVITLTGDIDVTDKALATAADAVIQSKSGEQYTVRLKGSSRLTVSSNKQLTLKSVKIIVDAEADVILNDTASGNDAYYNGYITVGSGAKLYVYDSHIEGEATDFGSSSSSLIRIKPNVSVDGYVQIERSKIITNVVGNTGVALYATNSSPVFRLIDSSVSVTSAAWLYSQGTIIMEGSTTVSSNGYTHQATIYNFTNTKIRAYRNESGEVELVKKGSGSAVSGDSYKIYYSLEENGIADGNAIEYTEPIADVSAETPIYVALYYSGTTYYNTPAEIYCASYEDGTLVSNYDELVEAIGYSDPVISLTADLNLNDQTITVSSGTVLKSKGNDKYTITLDGSSRIVTLEASTVTLQGLNIIIPSTADTMTSGYSSGGYIKVGSNYAKLYIRNCTITCASTDLGASDATIIRPVENTYCNVYIENSIITSQAANEKGALLGGANATYRVIDSTLQPKTSSTWLCTSTTIIAEGATAYRGWKANGTKFYDFSNTSVSAVRNMDGEIEFSKAGTGTAATSDSYLIYYSTDESAFDSGSPTEYSGVITNIDGVTPVYIALGYSGTTYYSTPVRVVMSYRGDVSGDGSIDSEDITSIRHYLLGTIEREAYIADINGDGNSDIWDLVLFNNSLSQ